MAGSEAEERIRAKAVERMRQMWPEGRIVHELQLEQGGVRIDLACVTPDRLILAEVKSERDVLHRLTRQLGCAMARGDQVWVCVAEKHAGAARDVWSYPSRRRYPDEAAYAEAQAYYRAVRGARLMVERAAGAPGLHEELVTRWGEGWRGWNTVDPRVRFDMLWRAEMESAISLHFGGATIPGAQLQRGRMTHEAVEHMSGAEIRRAVCRQIRARDFPRADPAIPVESANAKAPVLL